MEGKWSIYHNIRNRNRIKFFRAIHIKCTSISKLQSFQATDLLITHSDFISLDRGRHFSKFRKITLKVITKSSQKFIKMNCCGTGRIAEYPVDMAKKYK